MYYTVYQITNKVNGRIYIGCHKTEDLNDGYMGSGLLIKRAISKYGLKNFEKVILKVFDNPEDMFLMESQLVNPNDPNTYNIKHGGEGGLDHLNKNDGQNPAHTENHLKRMAAIRHEMYPHKNADWGKMGGMRSYELRKGVHDPRNRYDWTGKNHSLETRKKMSESKRGKYRGKNNSQFGTMWITDGTENKKIKKDSQIPDGWYRGRNIN